MAAKIDLDKCSACAACVDACPLQAIEMVEEKPKVKDDCADCGQCVENCPNQAIAVGE